MWKEIAQIPLTALLSLLELFLVCKLMGNKQISQLSMFDYIVGISIGSIAAEFATELEDPVYPAIAVLVYALVALGISLLSAKSMRFRKFMTGRPVLLMDDGVIYRDNMRRARFDLSDFLTFARIAGYYDISDVQTAILEENGTVSFLPRSDVRALEPRDIAQPVRQERVKTNVVLDGVVLERSLRARGRNAVWLGDRLRELGYASEKDVFLATLDDEGAVTTFPMKPGRRRFSPFD